MAQFFQGRQPVKKRPVAGPQNPLAVGFNQAAEGGGGVQVGANEAAARPVPFGNPIEQMTKAFMGLFKGTPKRKATPPVMSRAEEDRLSSKYLGR